MPPARALNGSVTFFGYRFPLPPLLLAAATLAASTLAAVGLRSGFPFLQWLTLDANAVAAGQLWRLVTWPFLELDPIALLFACLVILVFGRDLTYQWGGVRFLANYFGFTLAAGVGTCLLAAVWTPVRATAYFTAWPVADALIIAWAVVFPGRQMLLYFVLPLGGRVLVYAIVGITVLLALFGGFTPYVPHFLAQAAALAYLRRPDLRLYWARLRYGSWNTPARRRSGLRKVERQRSSDDEPPRWLH